MNNLKKYWNFISKEYHKNQIISCNDFHYGPYLYGENKLKILPSLKNGAKILELGCSKAQNTIFLTKKYQTKSFAIDIAEEQIQQAKKLANQEKVTINFIQDDLNNLANININSFDLIHSTNTFAYIKNQKQLIKDVANKLNIDGYFVLNTLHPAFNGNFIALDDNTEGMFIQNYFNTTYQDIFFDNENDFIKTYCYSIENLFNFFKEAKLELILLKEHQAPINYNNKEIPYTSKFWLNNIIQLQNIPFVLTLIAKKSY